VTSQVEKEETGFSAQIQNVHDFNYFLIIQVTKAQAFIYSGKRKVVTSQVEKEKNGFSSHIGNVHGLIYFFDILK
jgi:hypothetical protein